MIEPRIVFAADSRDSVPWVWGLQAADETLVYFSAALGFRMPKYTVHGPRLRQLVSLKEVLLLGTYVLP